MATKEYRLVEVDGDGERVRILAQHEGESPLKALFKMCIDLNTGFHNFEPRHVDIENLELRVEVTEFETVLQ